MTLKKIIKEYKEQIINEGLVVLLSDKAYGFGDGTTITYSVLHRHGAMITHSFQPGHAATVFPKPDYDVVKTGKLASLWAELQKLGII